MRWRTLCASASLAALSAAPPAGAQSSTETYTYDALGRLVKVVTSGGSNHGETQSICYDAAGNRTSYVANRSSGATTCSGASSPTPSPTPTPTPSPTPTPTPSLRIDDASVSEGGVLTFTVTLSSAASSTVSVRYATANGTATTLDYAAKSGTLVFSPGQTRHTLTVMTREDSTVEANEHFTVNLSSPSGATIADSRGVGTIINDDTGGLPPGDPRCDNPFDCF